MGTKKSAADTFPHIKGLAKKKTKFGHRWVLSAPDISGKIRNITVKILDNDSIEEFYRKVTEARCELQGRGIKKSFQAWIDEYITIRQLAKNSEQSIRVTLREFGLNNASNRESVKAILTAGYKDSTIKNKISQISSFFSWLSNKMPEISNPASDIRIKSKSEPRKRIATDEELKKMMDAVRQRKDKEFLLFSLLLLNTGARASTIMALRATDLIDNRYLRLYNVKSKKEYDYKIPLTNAECIDLWHDVATDGVLWHTRPKRYYWRLKQIMEGIFVPDETGERLSVHSLRHTFATNAIRASIPMEIVSKMLDHKSVSTTLSVYARFSQSQIDDAIQKISKN